MGVAEPANIEATTTKRGIGLPPPPIACSGYVRAAVVQLDFHAAAVCQQIHLLEQPPISPGDQAWPDWFRTDHSSGSRRVLDWQKTIGRELRNLYSQYQQKRLAEILATCSLWGVHLVVFPEYSVPPEYLEGLLPLTKGMTVVFGTHAVEPRFVKDGLYGRIGGTVPPWGTSVAPIAMDGVLRRFQPKLNKTHLEQDMTLGQEWESLEITNPLTSRMGILICLDYLHRDAAPYRDHVGAKIDPCRIVAVPSLTPYYTTDEFNARSVAEAARYGRSVLYANIADGGETSIHVDSDMDKLGAEFPYGIPRLARYEEGIIVADIDCEYTGVDEKSSRRYSDRTAAIPIAASLLRYATVKSISRSLPSWPPFLAPVISRRVRASPRPSPPTSIVLAQLLIAVRRLSNADCTC
jgi:predicted amidohydrolase